jgi:hypothetical protein
MRDDAGDFFGALFSVALLAGTYMWGKNKGYQKANFEHGLTLQQMEINTLKAELEAMKRDGGTWTKN